MLSRGLCIFSVHLFQTDSEERVILKASRFIRGRMGIHQIPPLRSLSHVKRRDLRGSETAAKGAQHPHTDQKTVVKPSTRETAPYSHSLAIHLTVSPLVV